MATKVSKQTRYAHTNPRNNVIEELAKRNIKVVNSKVLADCTTRELTLKLALIKACEE